MAYVWSIRKTKAVKERLKAIQKAGKLAYKYAQTSLLFVLTPTFYSLSFTNTPTQNASEDILPSPRERTLRPIFWRAIEFSFCALRHNGDGDMYVERTRGSDPGKSNIL